LPALRGQGRASRRSAPSSRSWKRSASPKGRAVVRAIRRALASGANEAFTFGRFESAIVHFHKTLAAALARAAA
jgi:hypothetical protein